MRLLSWNVNGIRAAERKGFLQWLDNDAPDILCVQETKAQPDQLSSAVRMPESHQTIWASAERKGYSGVAAFARPQPIAVEVGLGIEQFDAEGRTLILDFGSFVLFNLYVPNGQRDKRRVPFKLEFCEAFLLKAEEIRRSGKGVVACGDFNTAHKEIDLARPAENVDNTGFLPEERAWIDRFIARGYIDTLRHFNQEPNHYTWWDYKTFARRRNIGWRLDYFFVSEDLLPFVTDAFIMPEVMGSDHCPVGIELSEEVLAKS